MKYELPTTNGKPSQTLKDILDFNEKSSISSKFREQLWVRHFPEDIEEANKKIQNNIPTKVFHKYHLTKKSGFKDYTIIHKNCDLSPTIIVASNEGVICMSDKITKDSHFRKLTPQEREKLQGWPIDYTKYGINEKGEKVEMSTSQRNKITGNGVSSPVSQAIVEKLIGKQESVRVMSLCTGAGGMELNFPSNFKLIGMSEFNKFPSMILKYHHPEIKNYGDLTKINPNELPDFDLLTFGFPCQAYSLAGKRLGLEDTRGKVIYNIFDIIENKKPKYLLAENVKGLLSHDKGKTFKSIIKGLEDLGYDVSYKLLNSKNFGLAQNRERVFIFCEKKN